MTDEIDALLRRALERVSVKDAVSEVAAATGRPRREIYPARAGAQRRARRWRVVASGIPKPATAAGAPGRVPHRPFGGEPRRRVADRQGLSHPGAALPHARSARSTSSRDGATPGVRRGEGARHARRRGRETGSARARRSAAEIASSSGRGCATCASTRAVSRSASRDLAADRRHRDMRFRLRVSGRAAARPRRGLIVRLAAISTLRAISCVAAPCSVTPASRR